MHIESHDFYAPSRAPSGRPRVVFVFTFEDDRIAGIDLVANPESMRRLEPVLLDG